jgi:DNA replication protein DnaC
MTTSAMTLPVLLRALCLPTFAREYAAAAAQAAREGLSHEAYLQTLAMQEASDRATRRVERLIVESKLPRGKSLATFDLARLPPKVRTTVATLREGAFLDQATNVLVFGNPGTGKTHLVCGLGLELVRHRRPVLFAPTFQLVQRLLAAKRDLRLAAELKRLDRFEALILDDVNDHLKFPPGRLREIPPSG